MGLGPALRALEQTDLLKKLGANSKGSWCSKHVLEFGYMVLALAWCCPARQRACGEEIGSLLCRAPELLEVFVSVLSVIAGSSWGCVCALGGRTPKEKLFCLFPWDGT